MKPKSLHACAHSDSSGSALLEWLFAIAAGIFLILLLMQLYQVVLVENAEQKTRFTVLNRLTTAEQMLHNTLHLRSSLPCGETPAVMNMLRTSSALAWLDLSNSHRVYHHASKHAESLKATGSKATDRVPGSDVITTLSAGPAVLIKQHNPEQQSFELEQTLPLKKGALAVVCDTVLSTLFQVTAVRQYGRVISYRTARTHPGNCSAVFSSHRACDTNKKHVFAVGALLALIEPRLFYVGHAHHAGERSLFHKKLVLINRSDGRVFARMLAEELIEGIALLRGLSLGQHILSIGLISSALQVPSNVFQKNGLHLFDQDVSTWLPPSHRFYLLAELTFAV